MGNVAKLIKETRTDYLVCRIDRHNYDPRKSNVERSGRNYVWSRECDRCGTVRVQELGPDGRIRKNTYVYPDKYRFNGSGIMDAGDLAEIRLYIVVKGLA